MKISDPIAKMLDGYCDAEQMAGAAVLVWQDGKTVCRAAAGWRDREDLAIMECDTIFRIASMSKPVTSVAALMLIDEGRIALSDPIARWLPEFADMQVLLSPDGPMGETEAAARQITLQDLLTHCSGLTYGSFHSGPIGQAYESALGSDIDSPHDPDIWIARLAALPLIDQPGRGFHYGTSTDLLGFLIARIEGRPLAEVLERRIFGPLGMMDTGFAVPPAKRRRMAQMYGFDADGSLIARPQGGIRAGALMANRPATHPFTSGGAGLWSTLDDYLRFARLFVGDGLIDGVQLLSAPTRAAMMTNQLTADQRARAAILGLPVFAAHGFGLGLAVVTDPDQAPVVRCKGAMGTVGWPGAFGGWWQADPVAGRVMILLTHNLMELEQMAQGIGLGVYAAIADFHRLASGA